MTVSLNQALYLPKQQNRVELSKVYITPPFIKEAIFLLLSWPHCLLIQALGFPRSSEVKVFAWNCWRLGFDPWIGKTLEKEWQPSPDWLESAWREESGRLAFMARVGHN